MMYGWHDYGSGAATWEFMVVGMLLFWTFVAVSVVFLIRRSGGMESPEPRGDGTDRAEMTIRARYARGEIDEEDFAPRRDVLRWTP